MEHFISEFTAKIMSAVPGILYALAILVIGLWLTKVVRSMTRVLLSKRSVDPVVTGFVSSLVYYILMAFVVIAVLSQVGIATTSFVAVLGAAGLAVGLALQGSLSNFASGVLILLFKPFRVGDFVEVSGVSGTVQKILVFTTELSTPDNKQVIIPNAAAMSGNIVNYSTHPTRRVDLVIGVSYSDDLERVHAVLQQILSDDDRVLKEPSATIAVSELADSSVNFVVRPWVNKTDYWPVYFELLETVKKRFDSEGISIPFPQQDVYFHKHHEASENMAGASLN